MKSQKLSYNKLVTDNVMLASQSIEKKRKKVYIQECKSFNIYRPAARTNVKHAQDNLRTKHPGKRQRAVLVNPNAVNISLKDEGCKNGKG